jgi:hypothetical protein
MFDIETAPLAGNMWGMWKQNIGWNQITRDWYMLTWAAKWLDEDVVMYDSNHLHGDCRDDRPICESLHALLDEADMVVAHNGNKFDVKKVNARFILHGMEPPAPYRKIDTLIEARKNFAFTSNRLDALGDALGLGRKVDTGGFSLWSRCMEGDDAAFEEMVDYNVQDIILLEEVYLKLRPWMHNHPNVGMYNDDETPQCPKCGGTHINYRGTRKTQVSTFHRFQCQDCGGWGSTRYNTLDKDKRKKLVTNCPH